MPNWVNNMLTISDEYRSKILNSDNEVDFNIVAPMPESLDCDSGRTNAPAIYAYLSLTNTRDLEDMKKDEFVRKILKTKPLKDCSGTAQKQSFPVETSIESAYNLYRKMVEERPEQNDELYKEGQILVENFKNYGAATWYEWCIDNWGCKWNAGETEVGSVNKENKIEIQFGTPWSPPLDWLKALCKAGVPFYLEWVEDEGYHGEVISDGKEITENELDFIEYEDEDEDWDDDE